VKLAQSLNALSAHPAFTTTTVTEFSNHFGSICTFGIGCSTGGDRGLLDFLSVAVGPAGEANLVWADSANANFSGGESSPLVVFDRQVSGPSLYTRVGQVHGSSPQQTCSVGSTDAGYSANGTETAATPNLVIQRACITRPDPQHYKVTITVRDLSDLGVDLSMGGTNALWLVRWEVPVSNPSPEVQGHFYFAAMESDGGGAPTFYDGETSTVDTTHAKFLDYPPGNASRASGSFTAASPGTITITVPVADVGGNPQAILYSATALTATELPSDPIFNQINATAPFTFNPAASSAPTPGPTASPSVTVLAPAGGGSAPLGLLVLGALLMLAGACVAITVRRWTVSRQGSE
jgi:hypothetical protein